jgi:hypothetical protein
MIARATTTTKRIAAVDVQPLTAAEILGVAA